MALSQRFSVPLTQNSAPIFKFDCLYTHDLVRKQKRWQDGILCFHTFNRRVMVYEAISSNFIGDMHWREPEAVQDGDELRLDRGVIVNVGEQIGRQEQDLAELFNDRRAGKAQPLAHSTGFIVRPPDLGKPNLTRNKPKSLDAVLGAFRNRTGDFTRLDGGSKILKHPRKQEDTEARQPFKKPRLGDPSCPASEGEGAVEKLSTADLRVAQGPTSLSHSKSTNLPITVDSDEDVSRISCNNTFENPSLKRPLKEYPTNRLQESLSDRNVSREVREKNVVSGQGRKRAPDHDAACAVTTQEGLHDLPGLLLKAGRPKRKKLIFQNAKCTPIEIVLPVRRVVSAIKRSARPEKKERPLGKLLDRDGNELCAVHYPQDETGDSPVEHVDGFSKQLDSSSAPVEVRRQLRVEGLNMTTIDRNLLSRAVNPRRSTLKKSMTLPISKSAVAPSRSLARSKSDVAVGNIKDFVEDLGVGPWSREAFDLLGWKAGLPKTKIHAATDKPEELNCIAMSDASGL